MIFVGVDWAEDHHDVCVMDEAGEVVGRRRIADSVEGLGELHAAGRGTRQEPEDVVVGIEVDRGLVVTALLGAGYDVYAVNPMASSRYRDRHTTSGAKSDPGDAKVLADLVRTDRHNHRQIAGDSASWSRRCKIIARAHQNAIWGRQRRVNALRSALREYYPGALTALGPISDLRRPLGAEHRTDSAPRPSALAIQDRLGAPARRADPQRREAGDEIQAALRAEYLEAPKGDRRGPRRGGSLIAGAHRGIHRTDRHARDLAGGAF